MGRTLLLASVAAATLLGAGGGAPGATVELKHYQYVRFMLPGTQSGFVRCNNFQIYDDDGNDIGADGILTWNNQYSTSESAYHALIESGQWTTNNATDAWLQLDFGQPRLLGKFHIHFSTYPTSGQGFRILLSNDGTTWDTYYDTQNFHGDSSGWFTSDSPRKYIKYGNRRYRFTVDGVVASAFREMGIFDLRDGTNASLLTDATPEHHIVMYGAYNDSDPNAEYWGNMLDGDVATRGLIRAGASDEAQILINTGGEKATKLVIAQPTGNVWNCPEDFTLEYSEDFGQTWTTILSETGQSWTNGQTREFALPDHGGEQATPAAPTTGVENHRYWQFEFNGKGGSGQAYGLAEMYLIHAGSDIPIHRPGVATYTSSSHFGSEPGTYGAEKMFDGSPITLWSANSSTDTPVSITIDFGVGNAFDIKKVAMRARNDSSWNGAPTQFIVRYSDDGVTWTPYWLASGVSWSQGALNYIEQPAATPEPQIYTSFGSGYQGSELFAVNGGEWYVDGVATGVTTPTFTVPKSAEGLPITNVNVNGSSDPLHLWVPEDDPVFIAAWEAYDDDLMTLSGSEITAWEDRIGGRVATATGTGPTYNATARNNRPGVVVSGNKMAFSAAAMPVGTAACSVGLVGYRSGGGPHGLISWGARANGQRRAFGVGSGGNHAFFGYSGAYDWTAGTSWGTQDRTILWTLAAGTNPTLNIYPDGAGSASGSISTLSTPTTEGMLLAILDGTDRPWQGTAQCIIVADAVLTTDQRNKIEGYMAHKYGIAGQLNSGHPYRTTPPAG